MATNTYVALDKITVSGSSTNTVTFSAIPQTYKDLIIVCAGTQAALTDMAIRFNGDTAGNYSKTLFSGNGSTTVTAPYTNASQIFVTYQSTSQANVIIHIMNYADTSVQKTVLAKGSANGTAIQLNSGAWRKSPLEAINSVTIFPFGGTNFSDGYTVSLYGIAAEGTTPAPKATGGAIYSDSTYYYHVFGSTGVFTPSTSITADILQTAGGGGGGGAQYEGGGGGAGGVLAFASQSLTATNYAVTVGAGGPGGANASRGTNGNNSQFASLTASVGGGSGGNRNSPNGASGGSGGGGTYNGGTAGGNTSGQGFAGGAYVGGGGEGAGGGGAGGAGSNNTPNTKAGDGGAGVSTVTNWGSLSAIATNVGIGVNGFIAGGGGGGANGAPNIIGTGGTGGAGNGNVSGAGVNAVAFTGSGGGGAGGSSSAVGGNGASGVVIVRYLKA